MKLHTLPALLINNYKIERALNKINKLYRVSSDRIFSRSRRGDVNQKEARKAFLLECHYLEVPMNLLAKRFTVSEAYLYKLTCKAIEEISPKGK